MHKNKIYFTIIDGYEFTLYESEYSIFLRGRAPEFGIEYRLLEYNRRTGNCLDINKWKNIGDLRVSQFLNENPDIRISLFEEVEKMVNIIIVHSS